MAILDILEFPDPRLRNKAKAVTEVTGEIKTLVENMLETMYEAPGIGLAATQVNVHKRILVLDVSEEKDQPKVYINPEITPLTDIKQEYAEGCLSVPGFYEEIKRPEKVRVEAMGLDGKPFTEECEGLHAVCVQHEVDHLDGKLFVDYISSLKRQRIKKKLLKEQKIRA